MSKKVLAVLLAAMMLSSLAGCGGGGASSTPASGGSNSAAEVSGTVSEEEVMPPDAGVEEKDLNGYEFVVAEGHYYDGGDTPVLEPGISDLSDAIIARDEKIRNMFNCDIIYEYYNPVTFYETALPSLMAGDKFADVMTPTLFQYGSFFKGGFLSDLTSIPNIKLDQPYWGKQFQEAAKTETGTYGASAMFANPYLETTGVYFNVRLIKEFGLEDPYKLVEEDRWNWDTFKEMITKATKDGNADGQFTESADTPDVFACTGALGGSIESMYFTSGQKMFDINSAGNMRYALDTAKAIDAINKLKNMFSTPGAYNRCSFDYAQCATSFINGQATFYINPINGSSIQLRNMEEDYGLVPLPKGPNQKEYITALSHNTAIVCVPSTIPDPEATGAILEVMAFESYAEKQVWLDQLEGMTFRDDKAFEMFRDKIMPSIAVEPAYLYRYLDSVMLVAVSDPITGAVLTDQTLDVASLVDSNKDACQVIIDDIVNSSRKAG